MRALGTVLLSVVICVACRDGPSERSPTQHDSGVRAANSLPILRTASPFLTEDALVDDGIVVSGDPPGAPPGCNVEAVVARIQNLFDAIGRGDAAVGSTFFFGPEQHPFWRYYMKGPQSEVVFRDSELELLDAYFRERFEQRERLQLRAAQLNRWDQGLAHVGPIFVSRTAMDLPGGPHLLMGKTAFDCASGTFVVMTLTLPPPA